MRFRSAHSQISVRRFFASVLLVAGLLGPTLYKAGYAQGETEIDPKLTSQILWNQLMEQMKAHILEHILTEKSPFLTKNGEIIFPQEQSVRLHIRTFNKNIKNDNSIADRTKAYLLAKELIQLEGHQFDEKLSQLQAYLDRTATELEKDNTRLFELWNWIADEKKISLALEMGMPTSIKFRPGQTKLRMAKDLWKLFEEALAQASFELTKDEYAKFLGRFMSRSSVDQTLIADPLVAVVWFRDKETLDLIGNTVFERLIELATPRSYEEILVRSVFTNRLGSLKEYSYFDPAAFKLTSIDIKGQLNSNPKVYLQAIRSISKKLDSEYKKIAEVLEGSFKYSLKGNPLVEIQGAVNNFFTNKAKEINVAGDAEAGCRQQIQSKGD